MSSYVWDLSGTDNECVSYRPGHLVHSIQFKLSMREPSALLPVTSFVDDQGLVHIEGDGVALALWNHRSALVCAALQRFSGMAVWKPDWHLLAVPTESFFGSAHSVFNMAAAREKTECSVAHTTNPDHLHPSVPSPTTVPPLRVTARYAAKRKT